MKKYRAATMANGGKTPNGKKKASEKAEVVSRQQAVENKNLVNRREAEDRQSAANIRKSIVADVGIRPNPYDKYRPEKPLPKVLNTLAESKSAYQTRAGDYSRGYLADVLSGKKLPGGRKMQAPIFLKGETGGDAKNREISRGAGFTMGRDDMTSRMGVQRAVGAPVAKFTKAGEYTQKEKEYFKKYPGALRPQAVEYFKKYPGALRP